MSILFIVIIDSKARFASPPPAASASVSARGVICQERPQRSLHQPHWVSTPPLRTIHAPSKSAVGADRFRVVGNPSLIRLRKSCPSLGRNSENEDRINNAQSDQSVSTYPITEELSVARGNRHDVKN